MKSLKNQKLDPTAKKQNRPSKTTDRGSATATAALLVEALDADGEALPTIEFDEAVVEGVVVAPDIALVEEP